MLKEDLGTYYKHEILSLPPETDHQTNLIPIKEANPDLIWIIQAPIKLIYYKDTGKCFVYDEIGTFLGTLHKYELKRLFSKIGEVLKLEKNRKN